MHDNQRAFSPVILALNKEFVPLIRPLAEGGKYAISIGGSQGKGRSDSRSDVDYRLFCEHDITQQQYAPIAEAVERWGRRGVTVDGVWVRVIGRIDAALERWLNGELVPEDMVWTVWGYYLLPDIYHQAVVEDPYGLIRDWKRRLAVYPPALKRAVLNKHLSSLRYWRNDYHYRSKVERGDVVFLAGLSARLVHDMAQVLFALNETYFVGDGQNLDFVAKFRIVPPAFAEKVREALYPSSTAGDLFRGQYNTLIELIDEVLGLPAEVEALSGPTP